MENNESTALTNPDLLNQAGVVPLAAPVDGQVLSLESFPDPVFAQGLLGIGVGFMPDGDVLVAPVAAEVVRIFPGGNALVLMSQDLELLLHIGLDTVDLNGRGFTTLVREGDWVKHGQPLVKFDPRAISEAGKELHTALVVTNQEAVEDYALAQGGLARAGQTVVLAVLPK